MINEFCKKLIDLRQEKGYSQNEVALACNTSQETISRWEKGIQEPKASYLIYLAKFYNVSIDNLLGLDEEGIKINNIDNSDLFNKSKRIKQIEPIIEELDDEQFFVVLGEIKGFGMANKSFKNKKA